MNEGIRPRDFADEQPPQRIMGTEMEYAITNSYGGSDDYLHGAVLRPDIFAAANLETYHTESLFHLWLENGGQAYLDVGHLEYCTPEALGPRQLIAADIAGQFIVSRVTKVAEGPLNQNLRVFRRSGTANTQSHTVATKGFHINAITPTETAPPLNIAKLVPHLATRFYSWAGMVAPDGYSMSQKVHGLRAALKTSKQSPAGRGRTKPMAVIYAGAKDAAKNPAEYSRFEDRSADPSTPWGDFMAAATNSLLLRLLEHPQLETADGRPLLSMLDDVQFNIPANAMATFAYDPTLTTRMPTKTNRMLTAIDVQEIYMNAVDAMSQKVRLPPDELYALHEWKRIITDARAAAPKSEWQSLSDRIGFAAKLQYLEQRVPQNQTSRNGAAVLRCLGFDRTLPDGGSKIYAAKLGLHINEPAEIAAAITQAPPTRAAARVQIFRERPYDLHRIMWSQVEYLENKLIRTVALDPYQTDPQQPC